MESTQEMKPGPGHQKEYKDTYPKMQGIVQGKKKSAWTCEPAEVHAGKEEGLLQIYHQQKEDEGPPSSLLIREGELVTKNMGRVEVSYAFVAFVFVGYIYLQSLLGNNRDKAFLLLH